MKKKIYIYNFMLLPNFSTLFCTCQDFFSLLSCISSLLFLSLYLLSCSLSLLSSYSCYSRLSSQSPFIHPCSNFQYSTLWISFLTIEKKISASSSGKVCANSTKVAQKEKKKIKEKFQKEIHLKFHFLRVLLMCIEGFEVSELFVVVP